MQEPVENSGGQDRIVEDLTPIQETLVGSDDQAGMFVAAGNQAEEEAGFNAG